MLLPTEIKLEIHGLRFSYKELTKYITFLFVCFPFPFPGPVAGIGEGVNPISKDAAFSVLSH